jgi:hypothetical protein
MSRQPGGICWTDESELWSPRHKNPNGCSEKLPITALAFARPRPARADPFTGPPKRQPPGAKLPRDSTLAGLASKHRPTCR